MISTQGLELFASQVAGEDTDAGDGGLIAHTEFLHDSQDLVGLGAAVLDFVAGDNGVDDSVVPAHRGDNDIDDFARKARRQADLDALIVQCLQHVFDAWQRGRRVFLVRASKFGAEELPGVVQSAEGMCSPKAHE